MFEQASIESSGLLRRPWAMTVSFAGQAAVLSAVVLVSLIQTETLPRAAFFTGVVAPPPPPVQPIHETAARRYAPQPKEAFPFTAPAAIPKGISTAGPETPMLLPDEGTLGPGVPGGIEGFSSASSPLLRDVGRLPAPPPADPVRRTQEKPASSAPARPMRVSAGVQAAKLIRQVNPIYPPLAKQARIAGTVRLTAIIGRDGAIRNLEVVSGHPLLRSVALEAVSQWLYQPTLLNEEPVEVITQIDVNFTLSR